MTMFQFIKDDMKMRSSDSQRRANAFHEDDNSITVDDLWEAWFESPERAWTTEEVIELFVCKRYRNYSLAVNHELLD